MRRELTPALVTAVLLIAALVTTARAAPAGAGTTTTAAHIPLSGAPTTRSAVPTREVRTEEPFSMVALTWRGAAPDTIRVRHAEPGGWSEWTSLGTAHAAGRKHSARGSTPLWTGPTTAVQVRARSGHRDVSGGLELVAISPGTAPTPASEPSARAARPPVVTRAEWGADESLMRWPPEYTTTTEAVIVHHTAETNDYTCAQSAAVVRGIYYYHAVELGWGDIGYQALVDKCGTIFAGRTDGLTHHVVGGHTRGFNGRTFGVAMIGNFQTLAPPRAMVEGVAAIAGWKLGTVGVAPHGTTTLVSGGGEGTKYPKGTPVTLPTIFSHRDVNETVCPGNLGYAQLRVIRNLAAAQQA